MEGLLIYAGTTEGGVVHEIERSGKRIEIRTIDLTRPPAEVLEHIGCIAGRVREMAEFHDAVRPVPAMHPSSDENTDVVPRVDAIV
jgi:hypothetical protein